MPEEETFITQPNQVSDILSPSLHSRCYKQVTGAACTQSLIQGNGSLGVTLGYVCHKCNIKEHKNQEILEIGAQNMKYHSINIPGEGRIV